MTSEPHDCEAFERHLALVLSGEAELGDLAAARACPRCAPTLRSLSTVLSGPPEPEQGPAMAVELESARLGAASARRAAGLAAAARLGVGLGLGALSLWVLQWDDALATLGGHRVTAWWPVARAVFVSVAALALVTLSLVRRAGAWPAPLFLRWQGHQVNGVCTGLAQAFGLPVWVVRAIFVALFVTGLGGGTLYLALAFALTWSPEERAHLWRFRLRRLLGRG
jgi:phage shock protein PspC (stress-responsive transcriptional regulator)